ncbi:MAG: hypothetical protein K2L84_06365, partial [Muribaculaceae bacterium]|nr:hypothetical protein [Muribaculaceae bacterium]
MKFNKYIACGMMTLVAFAGTSCVDDLNMEPNDPNTKLELTTQEEWDGYLAGSYTHLRAHE